LYKPTAVLEGFGAPCFHAITTASGWFEVAFFVISGFLCFGLQVDLVLGSQSGY
jgi:hypothetical protein